MNKLTDALLKDLDNACEKFVQEYADKHNLGFDCAYYFLKRFYNINISIDINDDKCYCVFTSECKPIEQILEEDIDDVLWKKCEKELWGSEF